jgi:hypothetical protein
MVYKLGSTDRFESASGSELVIADPVVGMFPIHFDGPCRLVPRSLNLPSGYDSVQYESISATGSTTVYVSPGQEPFISTIGVCSYCAFDTAGLPGAGHDYELWPMHPGNGETVKPEASVAVEVEVEPVREPLRVVPEPDRDVQDRVHDTEEPGTPTESATRDATSSPPVDDQLDRDARMVARSVWFRGGQRRYELFQGRSQMSADALLDYAVERGWVTGSALTTGSVDIGAGESVTGSTATSAARSRTGVRRLRRGHSSHRHGEVPNAQSRHTPPIVSTWIGGWT